MARLSGFNGIGMYLNWKPVPGLHLDKRPPEKSIAWIALRADKLEEAIKKAKENGNDNPQVYFYLI